MFIKKFFLVVLVLVFFTRAPLLYAQYGSGDYGTGVYADSEATSSSSVSSNTTRSSAHANIAISSTPATPQSFRFTKNISFVTPQINDSNEVAQLESFLNEYEGEHLNVNGIYDIEDVAAVKRFQTKYRTAVLDVWKLPEATGYVGITTRLKINSLLQKTTAVCPAFTEYNGGITGIFQSEEVAKTQKMLQSLDLYTGNISGFWDYSTHLAMVSFQEKFHEAMLDPWQLTSGTGYKYKTTNKFLNYLAGCDEGAVDLDGAGTFDF